jgi:hypothetical protein
MYLHTDMCCVVLPLLHRWLTAALPRLLLWFSSNTTAPEFAALYFPFEVGLHSLD